MVRNPVIPSRDQAAADSSLVSGLGIGHYLGNFEPETQLVTGSCRIVTYGSTVIRISEVVVEEPHCTEDPLPTLMEEEEDDEPVAGPSGAASSSASGPR